MGLAVALDSCPPKVASATCLMNRYNALKAGQTKQLEKEYLERLYKAGVPSEFKSGEDVFIGTIKGVNDFGELMVEHEGEIRTYGHGAIHMEVKFDQA